MLRHDVYTLHVYRSRAPSGWQWAARLEHLPGGESRRFTDPEALLAHLRRVMRGVDRSHDDTEQGTTDTSATNAAHGGAGGDSEGHR